MYPTFQFDFGLFILPGNLVLIFTTSRVLRVEGISST